MRIRSHHRVWRRRPPGAPRSSPKMSGSMTEPTSTAELLKGDLSRHSPVMAHHSRDQAFIGHSGWIRRFWRRFGGHFRTLVRASRPDWTIGLATTSEAGITGRRRRQSPTPAVRQNDNYRQTVAPAIDGTRKIDRRYEAEIRFELHTRVKRRLLCWDDGFAWFPRPRDAPSPSSR